MTPTPYVWRDVRPEDLPDLDVLDDACFEADGPELVTWGVFSNLISAPDARLSCAVASGGQIAAVAWVRMNASPTMIGGKVHPVHRRKGLGEQAIRRAEMQVRERGNQADVIIRNEAYTEDAGALYGREGYATDFVEYWMSRPLRDPLPDLPPEVTLLPWSEDSAPVFYEIFIESFKDRGGPRASAEEWIRWNANDEDFRPNISALAYVDGHPAAFATAQIFALPRTGRLIGWITQIGVRPQWRGRGIVDGLIGEVGRRFAHEGLSTLDLDVNLNNPRAIRVYERNGFTVVGKRGKFSKTLRAG